jgi:polysaccharide deacetylase 2 family uncharacterized protein YibQ
MTDLNIKKVRETLRKQIERKGPCKERDELMDAANAFETIARQFEAMLESAARNGKSADE